MLDLGLADVALFAWYIGVLVLLEGLLSADNALVLAVMVRHLPKNQQRRVLFWGIWGAVGFRVLALLLSSILLALWYLQGHRRWLPPLSGALSFPRRTDSVRRLRRRSDVETERMAPQFLGNGHVDHRWPTSPSRLTRSLPPSAWPRAFPDHFGDKGEVFHRAHRRSARHHHDAIRRPLLPDSPRAVSRARRGCLLPGGLDWTEALDQRIPPRERFTRFSYPRMACSGSSCS